MTVARPSVYATMMRVAQAMAERSTCSSRAKVGAVIATRNGMIVATGYNGSPTGFPHCDDVGCKLDEAGHCLISVHAEENAIIQCALNGRTTRGMWLFATHSPCPRCAIKLVQARVDAVIYATPYKDLELTSDIFSRACVYFQQVEAIE